MEGNLVQEVDGFFRNGVDDLFLKVDKLEQRVNEVQQFYLTTSELQLKAWKNESNDKEKEKHVPSTKKQQQDASHKDVAAAKRMQELMRQFGTILRQGPKQGSTKQKVS